MFFFNVSPTTHIYTDCHTLSLHYGFPISLLTDAVVELVEAVGKNSVKVQRETLPAVVVKLRDDLADQQLIEIAGVDYPDRPERFEICYHLLSLTKSHSIRVKVATDEAQPVPSITDVWQHEIASCRERVCQYW